MRGGVPTGFDVDEYIARLFVPRRLIRKERRHGQESPAALHCVSNAATFGLSEAAPSQLGVDGVKLLVAMEKRMEGGGAIDDLIPTQK
ncbi:Creatine kinase M-type [Liparis tanakae]|uniref:Creatine kinase M-type n=1 Tax=Liparis tanakae TaxID=230148 RepID=A0A4Z2EV14_9TELE|nr:Creatine kinase M-type [Liparis tanakae]